MGWVDRTPEGFIFSVKAHQSLTHEREEAGFAAFHDSVAPLAQAGKLGCVLAQFPHSFHATAANRDYLPRLREGLGDLPAVVEFRDARWVSEETFEQLAGSSWVSAASTSQAVGLMPPIARATGPLAYVRFHGRNAGKWWEHENAFERYDYSYADSELIDWAEKIHRLDGEVPLTLVYANNHYRGQSVGTIHQLQGMLAGM
jgi:uncharacterized protein YecE (DUF72 family)